MVFKLTSVRVKFEKLFKEILEYTLIVGFGLLRIYKKLFLVFARRLYLFTLKEILYYMIIAYSTVLTGMGWMHYELVVYNEVYHHNISSDDFLIFFTGFVIMSIPGLLKLFTKQDNNTLKRITSIAGLTLVSAMYIITVIHPDRITSMSEASFTVWFYLFGANVVVLWIIEVLGIISMPSTHLKS